MSRFVSAGTTSDPKASDEAWLKVQADLEAKTQAKLAEGQQVSRWLTINQEGGKSLYEHLQARKAAKQEAFEEASKLKNQFRALDEDEINFLDAVEQRARSEAAAARKETSEQLDAFRRQQEEAEKKTRELEGSEGAAGTDAGTDAWAPIAGKKRRKGKEGDMLKGVKARKKASEDTVSRSETGKVSLDNELSESKPKTRDESLDAAVEKSTAKPKSLGLAGYSSDEDE